jgi:pimeloyl-ACP methyl ester carboxylesterase
LAATRHRTVEVEGLEIFYRENGNPGRPAILFLHGFPSSSHMYRDLLADLGAEFHCVAPDLPGFGLTESPPADRFDYTFDRLAEVAEAFTRAIGLARFSLYVFDFGAPVGMRLAAADPDRIDSLIVQNGNMYEDGLAPSFAPLYAYWKDRAGGEDTVRGILTAEATRFQYTEGVRDLERLAPEAWTLDQHFLDLPGRKEAMLDLFYDYRTNVERYPEWQSYLREHRPPTLVMWGRNDPYFTPAGAEAIKRDVPEAVVHLLDTGHFAVEDHGAHIASEIRSFLALRPA